MSRQIQGLLAVVAMMASVSAHAKLKSVDGGLAVEDSSGLEFANIVGIGINANVPQGGTGTPQGYVAALNAEDYGGYNNWTLATDNGTTIGNNTTNQLGQLFYSDCGATVGATLTSCGKFTALNGAIARGTTPGIDGAGIVVAGTYGGTFDFISEWSTFFTLNSTQSGWCSDCSYDGIIGQVDVVAVRNVNAPELDTGSAASGFTLLLGGVAVMRGRRKIAA